MTLDEAVRDLAGTGNELPRDALNWALDNWDQAGPRFVALLDGYASGTDRSEQTERALFFAIHLLGERAETAAAAPLCRLLLDAEAADLVLGDAITSTLSRVLVSLCAGEVAPLQAVIEAEAAEQHVRYHALLALAYLVRIGAAPGLDMPAYLRRLLAEMQPQEENFAWVGWTSAVSALGYEELAGPADVLFERGLVARSWMHAGHFRDDLKRTLDDPARMAGFTHENVGSMGSTIKALERWHCFSGDGDAEPDAWPAGVQRPIHNPLRGVGRNDPCPCGSGRKFKKCCLA